MMEKPDKTQSMSINASSPYRVRNNGQSDFACQIFTKLNAEMKDDTENRALIATPALLLLVLTKDESVREYLNDNNLVPDALEHHAERIYQAYIHGQILESRPQVNHASTDIEAAEQRHYDIQQNREERSYHPVKQIDPSNVHELVRYEPKLLEFISAYIASVELVHRKPSMVGLFKATIKEYGKTLGAPIEKMSNRLTGDTSSNKDEKGTSAGRTWGSLVDKHSDIGIV